MEKNEKVPETKDVKPNREQRRHPEKLARPDNEPPLRDDQLTGQDVQEPRTNKTGQGKKTADKWNQ